MPKRDTAYMDRKRREILDAAFDCLCRTGMSGFSTTQICVEAGISMGALYTHFKSKEEILIALINREHPDREAMLAIDSFDKFRTMIIEFARSLNTLKAIQQITIDLELLTASITDAKMAAAMHSAIGQKDFQRLLEKFQNQGEIRHTIDVKGAAAALAAMLLGFSVFAATGGYYVKSRVAAVEMLLNSLKE